MEDDISLDSGLSSGYDFSLGDTSLAADPSLGSSDPFSAASISYPTTTYTAPTLPYSTTQTAASALSGTSSSSSSGGTLSGIASIFSPLSSLVKSIGSVVSAGNTQQAGSFNASDQFVPLSQSNGVIQTPGQTSFLGGSASGSSSAGLNLSGLTSTLTSFAPWIIGGVILLLVVKLFKR